MRASARGDEHVTQPTATQMLVDAVVAPLTQLIDDYADVQDVLAELIADLEASRVAISERHLRPKPQRGPGTEGPEWLRQARPAPVAHAAGSASLTELQEQLSLLEGVASVRASVPAGGTPTLVVELVPSPRQAPDTTDDE